MNWDNVKVFLAVERAGSIAGAGNALSIDESTVARRLKSLEEALEARLFYTLNGNRKLSAFGEQILHSAQEMEAAKFNIEAASRNAREKPSGTISISASTMVARHILMPRVGDFRCNYPDMILELSASNDIADLTRLEADIAIRMVRPREGDYTIRKIGKIEYGVYEHRDHRGSRQWIGFAGPLAEISHVKDVSENLGKPPCITTNEPSLMLEAVLTGKVAAILPRFVGDKMNELVRVETMPSKQRGCWFVFRSDMNTAPNIRIAMEWIKRCFRSVLG